MDGQIRWRLQIELSPTETATVSCFFTCSFWAESLQHTTCVEQRPVVVAVKVWASRGKLIVETCAKVTRSLVCCTASRHRELGTTAAVTSRKTDTNLVLLSTTLWTESLRFRGFRIGLRRATSSISVFVHKSE